MEKIKITLQAISPEKEDKLRDAQRAADQKVVDELRDKIARLEARLEDIQADNERLEAWVKTEKKTYRLQYIGPGGHM